MTTATKKQSALVAPLSMLRQPTAYAQPPDVIDLLGALTRAYTHHHNDLAVCGAKMAGSIALSVQGNKDDHGRLVGIQGMNIWALQTIFTRIGRKMGLPVRLTLLAPTVGTQQPVVPFASDPSFKHGATTALLQRVLAYALAYSYDLLIADVGDNTHYEITVSDDELPIVRGDLVDALHNIFHAIGKNRGRIIHLSLNDPEAPPVIDRPQPMTPAETPPPVQGHRVPTAADHRAAQRPQKKVSGDARKVRLDDVRLQELDNEVKARGLE